MKIVKLKEDVNFDILLEFGFLYNNDVKRYERPIKWTLYDVCHQLVVEEETRWVYTDIRKTSNVNEEYADVTAKLSNVNLLLMYPYIEIVDDETSVEGKVILNK